MSNNEPRLGIPRNDGQLSIILNKGGARSGSGKKRLGLTKKTSLTLTEDIWKKIESYCKEHKISQSEALRNMINHYFEK
ncbi:hypothetical protein [Cohnella soli]|uniref:Ribbon-helix-helix protein CopG domain-containing protein n=1 Tax=Cohnella soli TaxID=425005 RepID=A0ABW0HZC1_9BACL